MSAMFSPANKEPLKKCDCNISNRNNVKRLTQSEPNTAVTEMEEGRPTLHVFNTEFASFKAFSANSRAVYILYSKY